MRDDSITKLNSLPLIKLNPKPKQDPNLIYPYGRYSETEFLNTLVNKKVIIVGPAGYLQGQNKGEWIDSFDVVVRVNHALPIEYEDDYGKRTDVLYHILSHRGTSNKTLVDEEEIDLWVNAKLKWLVTSHHAKSKRVNEMGPIINSKLKWACVHHRFSTIIKQQVDRKAPNTGILAIAHLLSSRLQSLTVIGFDLYQSGVYQGYGDLKEDEDALEVNKRWHDVESQITFLRKLKTKERYRLIIDERLQGILRL
jgi:hypothetical protein